MKALIAMSGGVDSSVAACLMKDKGYECIGCTMKLYSNEDAGLDVNKGHTCCSLDDVEDARSVANSLGMPHYVLNFADKFKEKVIDDFVNCYEQGKTPNPCIECNRYLKFEKLLDTAKSLDCDKIVTGHYARIEKTDDGYVLKKAVDDTKDQSYVLYSMTQEMLSYTEFPLGAMSKNDARLLAKDNDFINADKPDSQDICFVPDGDYVSAIKRFTNKEYPEGDFVDANGNVLGRHKGIISYTIGQRRGLGISAKESLYVCRICPEKNQVVLGSNDDLFSRTVLVQDMHWISGKCPDTSIRCKAKIRYRHKEEDAVVNILEDNRIQIVFDEPQRAVTPGQAAVLYDGDIVLGGGKIIGTGADN